MKFEDFVSSGQEDIFLKTKEFARFVNSGVENGTDALGLRLLSACASQTTMEEKDGTMRSVIMLGSNSYLNLTTHPQVMDGARRALEKYGYGMGAVSLYGGITDLHKELERKIAAFYHQEDAILFPSGYGTNIGVIASLCGAGDVIINDSANHASIFDGSRMSGATLKVYPHSNVEYLEKLLRTLPESSKGRLIVTDGVFSMHGDMAQLDRIYSLARKYGARLMVDDAHGLGIVGPSGRGTAEHFGLLGKVDINVGMLSKVPGAIGGYCAASREVVEYLRYYARTYFFSTAIPAPVVGGLIEVFNLLENDQAGRTHLWHNIHSIKQGLEARGFKQGDSASGIVPLIVGDEEKLFKFHRALRHNGVYTNVVSYPAVRRKECRLRICVMKDLSEQDIERALNIIEQQGKLYGIIQ